MNITLGHSMTYGDLIDWLCNKQYINRLIAVSAEGCEYKLHKNGKELRVRTCGAKTWTTLKLNDWEMNNVRHTYINAYKDVYA